MGEIKTKIFYTLIKGCKAGSKIKQIYAVRKEGIEFERYGMILYAYQRMIGNVFPVCYIIDPETGLSINTVEHPLIAAPRHISRNAINKLKQIKADCNNREYQKKKEMFKSAKRVDALED